MGSGEKGDEPRHEEQRDEVPSFIREPSGKG